LLVLNSIRQITTWDTVVGGTNEMHYIRLLRPPTVNRSNPNAPVLSITLTITTDLGDTFLSPDEPIWLTFGPIHANYSSTHSISQPLLSPAGANRVFWRAGMRVLKVDVPLPAFAVTGRVAVPVDTRSSEYQLSARETVFLLPWRIREYGKSKGLIVPLTIELNDGVGSDVALRDIRCQCSPSFGPTSLEIGEDIGESIARHIWDAGLVTVALLADGCRNKKAGFRIHDFMPIATGVLNILELGSGVGVLSIGIGTFIHTAAKVQGVNDLSATVVLTDLPEAEERARSNIDRYKRNRFMGIPQAELEYENLDWEDGSRGEFGPLVSSKFWDFIVLSDCTYNVDTFPVLVETLSALHSQNMFHSSAQTRDNTVTKVILSTKPRHDSEKALFELLDTAGWTYRLLKSVPLLKLGGEDEVVEVYALEKQGGSTHKRKGEEETGRPAKRSAIAVTE
jgi:hypothetical protein